MASWYAVCGGVESGLGSGVVGARGALWGGLREEQ